MSSRPHIENRSYWSKPAEQLRYIIKDARETIDALATIAGADTGKYADQINDACTVLYHRSKRQA